MNAAESRVSNATSVFTIEEEADGRWIADFPSLPGCMTYDAHHA